LKAHKKACCQSSTRIPLTWLKRYEDLEESTSGGLSVLASKWAWKKRFVKGITPHRLIPLPQKPACGLATSIHLKLVSNRQKGIRCQDAVRALIARRKPADTATDDYRGRPKKQGAGHPEGACHHQVTKREIPYAG